MKQSITRCFAAKKIVLLFVILISSATVFSQGQPRVKLYNPEENAEQAIESAIKKAKAENKHVFIEVGGNWCVWCIRFHDFITTIPKIDSLIKANYIVYNLNFSPENYNTQLINKYDHPERFGFPVFLILDGDGKLIHTQDSSYLENEEKGYGNGKVSAFFRNWTYKALHPKHPIGQ